jgi:hypothetical protein
MAAPKKTSVVSRRSSDGKSGAHSSRSKVKSTRSEPQAKVARATSVTNVPATRKIAKKPKLRANLKTFDENTCASCSADLRKGERALFVEEEVGRVFCTEECIATFFASDIDFLEKDWQRHRQKNRDLTDEERESFAHLRWVTLEQPDEIWRERTATGDWRYTLISEFQPGDKRVWCVAICLFLRGEPSFLFLAVPTRDATLVGHYRKGERVVRQKRVPQAGEASDADAELGPSAQGSDSEGEQESGGSDGLADSWTHEETIRAQMRLMRSKKDIPESRFEEFEASIGQTLEAPDEVWSSALSATSGSESGDEGAESLEESEDFEEASSGSAEEDHRRLYHFIKAYGDETPPYWYVVIARDTPEEGQIEVLDSFPTNDVKLVESLRVGTHEFGENEPAAYSRLVH